MYPTVSSVYDKLTELIEKDDNFFKRMNKHLKYPIRDEYDPITETSNIYKDLSIFDWWKDNLTRTDLNHMLDFCSLAMVLGFNGYVCFKVGASGCASGMWAHKEKSEDGFSPNGDFIYRSFTPDETYYSIKDSDIIYPRDKYNAWEKTDLIKYVEHDYKNYKEQGK